MSGGIRDGRVAIAEEWSILVRAYGGEKNIGRNNQIQRKMVFYCLLRFFVRDIKSGIPCTAPPQPPHHHSPTENQHSAKVLVKRLCAVLETADQDRITLSLR